MRSRVVTLTAGLLAFVLLGGLAVPSFVRAQASVPHPYSIFPSSGNYFDLGYKDATSDFRWRSLYVGQLATPVTTAGGASATGAMSGRIYETLTPTSSATAGGAEQDLLTYTLPASTLSANGAGVRVRTWGLKERHGTVRLYFGTQSFLLASASGANTAVWEGEYTVYRATNASAQAGLGRGLYGDPLNNGVGGGQATSTISSLAAQQDLTTALTIKVTGRNGLATNDVTAQGLTVEFFNPRP